MLQYFKFVWLCIMLRELSSYVLAAATGSFFLAVWHGLRVGSFRKPAKIPYPNAYASAETISSCDDEKRKQAMYLFNCAQRAHYNFLENYVAALPAMLIGGLGYPRAAAGLGLVWCISRVLYAIGYTDPKKEMGKGRYRGILFFVAQTGLFGLVGKMGYDLLMS